MLEKVIFKKGPKSTLPQDIHSGQLLITDVGTMFLDYNDSKRIQIIDDTKLPLIGGILSNSSGTKSIEIDPETCKIEIKDTENNTNSSISTETISIINNTNGNKFSINTQDGAVSLVEISENIATAFKEALNISGGGGGTGDYLPITGGTMKGNITLPDTKKLILNEGFIAASGDKIQLNIGTKDYFFSNDEINAAQSKITNLKCESNAADTDATNVKFVKDYVSEQIVSSEEGKLPSGGSSDKILIGTSKDREGMWTDKLPSAVLIDEGVFS